MGLLGDIFSASDRLKRNVKGLLDDPASYLEMIGGLLTDDRRAHTARTDRLLKGTATDKDYSDSLAFALNSIAPLGMTAWHGSPHKFDKFSLDKIGTGEGAQAYGHGLYLAESPEVAKTYKVGGQMGPEKTANYYLSIYKTQDNAMSVLEDELKKQNLKGAAREYTQSVYDLLKQGKASNGNLYKTDIPDEAVARFLDWDKPLSQQAPEVQAALAKMRDKFPLGADGWDIRPFMDADPLVSTLHNSAVRDLGVHPDFFTKNLSESGVHGIRYLDGGSRADGAGTSNFVVFSPEMIRILERNGQATGLQPWKPGEWRGLLD